MYTLKASQLISRLIECPLINTCLPTLMRDCTWHYVPADWGRKLPSKRPWRPGGDIRSHRSEIHCRLNSISASFYTKRPKHPGITLSYSADSRCLTTQSPPHLRSGPQFVTGYVCTLSSSIHTMFQPDSENVASSCVNVYLNYSISHPRGRHLVL